MAISFTMFGGNPLIDAVTVGVMCGYLDGRKKET